MNVLHDVFPVLVLLVLFLLSLTILAGALFHLKQKVAFVPTGPRVVRAMIGAAEITGTERVVELGAGDARFLIALRKHWPDLRMIGYEGAWWVYLFGKFRLRLAGVSAELRHRDFFLESLRDADVIFAYLSVHAMRRLLPKFQEELRPGTRIISHAFSLPGMEPERVLDIPMRFGSTRIWCYRTPLRTSGAPTESSM